MLAIIVAQASDLLAADHSTKLVNRPMIGGTDTAQEESQRNAVAEVMA
jgi:hypothetical protein